MNIDKSLLDKLLKGAETAEDLFGRDGIVQKLKKAMVEQMLEAEMSHHLGYIRKVIYTTNTIESINYGIRKVTKNRTIFPDDKAACKLIYLALRNLTKRWNRPIFHWKKTLNLFAIIFGDRITKAL